MFLLSLLQNMLFFTGSYSNNVFPEPLNEKEEKDALAKLQLGDEEARDVYKRQELDNMITLKPKSSKYKKKSSNFLSGIVTSIGTRVLSKSNNKHFIPWLFNSRKSILYILCL